jgi:hypothetical protein
MTRRVRSEVVSLLGFLACGLIFGMSILVAAEVWIPR